MKISYLHSACLSPVPLRPLEDALFIAGDGKGQFATEETKQLLQESAWRSGITVLLLLKADMHGHILRAQFSDGMS
jgi:hypothetical protein